MRKNADRSDCERENKIPSPPRSLRSAPLRRRQISEGRKEGYREGIRTTKKGKEKKKKKKVGTRKTDDNFAINVFELCGGGGGGSGAAPSCDDDDDDIANATLSLSL